MAIIKVKSKKHLLVTNEETEARGGVVVEALRYKPEGHGLIPDGVTGFFH
jgi:hypothetical protein